MRLASTMLRIGCAAGLGITCLLAAASAGEPVALTTGPGNDTEAAWSPDARRIVFQSDRSGTLDLYLLDLETREVKPLVAGPGHACFPAWSPDGRWIVYAYAHFTTTAFERKGDGYNLFVVSAEGATPRRLTQGLHRDYAPTFTPDGKTIWFSSDRGRSKKDNAVGLYTIPVEGGEPVGVFCHEGQDRAAVQPTFSPDGRLLAFGLLSGFRDNWTVHLARADQPADRCPLTDAQGCFYGPRWSPTAARLACTGFAVGDAAWNVYLINPQTAGRLRVDTGPGNSRSPAWSPDGRQLVFENNRSGHYKLYCLEVPESSVSPPPKPPAIAAESQVLGVSFAQRPGIAVLDQSPQANAIQVAGKPVWSEGAMSFPPGSYLTLPKAQGFDFGPGPFSVRAVVTVPKDCRFAMICMGEYPGNRLGWQLYVNDQRQVMFNSRTTELIYRGARSVDPLPTDRPVTLIGVRDAEGQVRLYVDGALQPTTTQDAFYAYGSPVQVRIGSQHDGSACYPGAVREVTVYRRALSSDEIRSDSLARFWQHASKP